ncbi:probable protein, unknown function [Plasmodium sp. DRC-Itaito]|nr:probable protein, unknown function [Plasmodium sp. DRC-Itaito]
MITNMNFVSLLKRVFSRPSNCLLCLILCMMSFHSYCLLFDILERLIIIPKGSNQIIDVSKNGDLSLPFVSEEIELKISGDHSGLEELDISQNTYEYVEQDIEHVAIDNYEIESIEQYSDESRIDVYVEKYYENNELDENQEKQMESNEEQEIEDSKEQQMEDNQENNMNSTKHTIHNNLRIHKTTNETDVSEDTISKISSEYIIYSIFSNVMKMSKEVISLIAKAFMMNIEKEEDNVKKEHISEYNYSDIENILRIVHMIWLFDINNTSTLCPNSR